MESANAQTRRMGSFDSGGFAASTQDGKKGGRGFAASARNRLAQEHEPDASCHPEQSAQRGVEGSSATAAVAFEGASKRFGDVAAVDDVSLVVEEGSFVTVVGSSGCGKTTLLKMVNALVKPDEGRVLVHERATADVDVMELRRTIGYAIQGSVLFPHLTVEQNIAYVPSLLNRRDKRRTSLAVETWMDFIGLPAELRGRYPAELSGGQAQRVGIARALAASPDVLLMDEPFSAVDAITRASLQDEIRRVHRETGITVLFVTHDIDEALDLGDKVLVMEAGRAVQFAPPREVLRAPASAFVEKLVARKRSVYARM